jgi:hypothetical protein
MTMRRVLAGTLAALLVVGTVPALAQQAVTGVISGRATDEVDAPYEDYRVQLRSAETGLVVATEPLTAQGLFSFSGVAMTTPLLVELVDIADNDIICSEGPYTLTAPNQTSRTSVNIECGGSAAWLLLAAAGLPGVVLDPRSADR